MTIATLLPAFPEAVYSVAADAAGALFIFITFAPAGAAGLAALVVSRLMVTTFLLGGA